MPEVTIPPPHGGWNLRDSETGMDPRDALCLENWIPRRGFMQTRGGTTMVGPFNAGAAITGIYDYPPSNGGGVLTNGAAFWSFIGNVFTPIPPPTPLTGAGSKRWNHTHFQNKLILCNGVDDALVYDGATLVALNVTAGPAANTLWGCITFKGRVFYWAQNSRKFIYAPVGSYQGALAEFDLSQFTTKGGYLHCAARVSLDSGDGPNDYIAFIFNTGETLVYKGSDPASATDWGLINRFVIGKPHGPQAVTSAAPESFIVTDRYYMDLATAFQKSGSVQDVDVPIVPKIVAGGNVGQEWAQVAVLNQEKLLLVFKYDASNGLWNDIWSLREVDVKALDSGAWTLFTGWYDSSGGISLVSTAGVVGDTLYLGGTLGRLFLYDPLLAKDEQTGILGESAGTYEEIYCYALQAYNDLGAPFQKKMVTAYAVISDATAESHQFALPTDYAISGPSNRFDQGTYYVFGAAGGPTVTFNSDIQQEWRLGGGVGRNFAVQMRVVTLDDQIRWYGTRLQAVPVNAL